MTWAILDDFTDKYGRWPQWSPWDTTQEFQASKGFLTTQQHVDLRTFRPIGYKQLSMSDLDAQTMTQLNAQTMTQLELLTLVSDENWVKTGTGFNAMTVGKVPGKSGWSGLQCTTSGAAISTTFTSSMTKAIDISTQDNLSIIFPDFNTFDGTSSIQLCSNASGDFSTSTSATLLFSANTSVMPQLRFAISSFANAGFDPSKVTGVKIILTKAAAPAAGLTFNMMAIRAVKSTWAVNSIDFDTRFGQIVPPVTLDGATPTSTIGQIPLIRGDFSKLDPIPADGALLCYFNCGGEVNRSSGTNYNFIDLIFRETRDSIGNTGSWMTGRLRFNGSGTQFSIFRTDWNGTTETLVGTQTDSGIGTLDPTQVYLFQVSYVGTTINASLWLTDGKRNPTNLVWRYAGYSGTEYPYRGGRVGLKMTLLDRDAYVDYFDAAPRGYARFRSTVALSHTPVDGAQIAVVSASDLNLFQTFTAADLFIDKTKTLSGQGSYRSAQTLVSNSFIIEDWVNSYFDCSIWVSASTTLKNQPQVLLGTPSGDQALVTRRLQPAQWNSLHFDLSIFRNLVTGTAYQIKIKPGTQPDTALGNYWVDNTVLGRRRVAWRFRAQANGTFRSFKETINSAKRAVHLPAEERGTSIQVECEALTSDAWTGPYKLFPRYAQLGNPVYDQGFETRL